MLPTRVPNVKLLAKTFQQIHVHKNENIIYRIFKLVEKMLKPWFCKNCMELVLFWGGNLGAVFRRDFSINPWHSKLGPKGAPWHSELGPGTAPWHFKLGPETAPWHSKLFLTSTKLGPKGPPRHSGWVRKRPLAFQIGPGNGPLALQIGPKGAALAFRVGSGHSKLGPKATPGTSICVPKRFPGAPKWVQKGTSVNPWCQTGSANYMHIICIFYAY